MDQQLIVVYQHSRPEPPPDFQGPPEECSEDTCFFDDGCRTAIVRGTGTQIFGSGNAGSRLDPACTPPVTVPTPVASRVTATISGYLHEKLTLPVYCR